MKKVILVLLLSYPLLVFPQTAKIKIDVDSTIGEIDPNSGTFTGKAEVSSIQVISFKQIISLQKKTLVSRIIRSQFKIGAKTN